MSKRVFGCTGTCDTCRRCRGALFVEGRGRKDSLPITLPEDFYPDGNSEGYGIAFDLGTTTVVGVMADLGTGRITGTAARRNGQAVYGQDVISRIAFAQKGKKELTVLRQLALSTMNEIISELKGSTEVAGKDDRAAGEGIVKVAVGGNSTMSHIFTGHDPRSLAFAPFAPAYTGTWVTDGKESGLDIDEKAVVKVLPSIGGHVGGDITAGILAERLYERKGTVLLADIGTNGEVVLSLDGDMTVCSAAAGPAFEGAAICCGMRDGPGAVNMVSIENDNVMFSTVYGTEPIGICGSGIIDAVAAMSGSGVIDETGRIFRAEEFSKMYPASSLAERIRTGEEGREFVLIYKEDGEDIVITQADIRAVQTAKAAIYAGMMLLLKKSGKTLEDIDEVILAGSFGNRLDKERAVAIGMLPPVDTGKIRDGGNTACAGVLMALLSDKEADKAEEIRKKARQMDLAGEEEFQKGFIEAMSFPK